MKRVSHILTKNCRNERPTNILFWDTESHIVKENENYTKLPLRLWYAILIHRLDNNNIYNEKHFWGYTVNEFIKLLEEKCLSKQTLYVIGYNIKHDLACSNLIEELSKHNWEIVMFYNKATTLIVRMKKSSKRIVFLDGLNWFSGTLESWGKIVGVEKYVVNFENCTDDELLLHCKNDCIILQKMFLEYLKFLDDGDYGAWKYTKASQAFAAFRHRFMNCEIKIHDNQEVIKLERKAYGGGLVRIYRCGEFDNSIYYQLDVNSMYPFVMLKNKYPVKLISYRSNVDIDELSDIVQDRSVIVDAIVKPNTALFRRKTKEYVIYPKYAFRGAFNTPEVVKLLETNSIIKINKVAIYKNDFIFQDFVEHFYNKRLMYRKSGNITYERFCKDLLNSLYGKFGSKTGGLKEYPHPDEIPAETIIVIETRTNTKHYIYWINNKPYVLEDEEETYNSFPAVAAHVTAYARIYLQELVEVAGIENVYYTDTDSLIVNETGFNNLKHLISESELGKLKIEYCSDDLTINARKDYHIGDKYVLKGVNEEYRRNNIDEIYRNEWMGLLSLYGVKRGWEYGIIKRKLNLNRQIYDGIKDSDGFVIPYDSPPDFDPKPFEFYE